MGDFIINFYYKHAPNLVPEVLIHSPFLLQYSLGKFISVQHNSKFIVYVAGRTLELVESAHKSSNKHNSDKEDDSPSTRLLPCVCYCLLMFLLCNRSLNNKFLLCKAYLVELLSRQSEALTVMNDISQVCIHTNSSYLLSACICVYNGEAYCLIL